MNVREELFKFKDLEYKEFNRKLIPTINEEKIIGVRLPKLREIAKKLENDDFLWEYYEEIMLHGLYIGYSKISFEEKLSMLDEFVPKIDNWAICDSVCATLKFVNKNKDKYLEHIKKYMYSNNEFEKRFFIVSLMDYYVDDEYAKFAVNYLKNIKSDFYYVNMAAGWALSVFFVYYKELVFPLIKDGALSKEINNITISKIRDSYRVSIEDKEEVKKYRIK